jgi:AraC-like DNA-binding protein/quercetin dioxygenase-like cupin family protein
MNETARGDLKEDRKHGDALFPLAVYRVEVLPGATVLDYHWHEEAEFFYVERGRVQFQIGTSMYELGEGEAVFIQGGEIHAGYAADDSSGCTFLAAVFDMALLSGGNIDAAHSGYIVPLLDNRRTLPRHIRGTSVWEQSILHSLRELLRTCMEKRLGYELAAKAYLLLIIAEVAAGDHWTTNSRISASEAVRVERLKTVISYIRDHYADKLSIGTLARLVHMSEGEFCRFFKAMTRKTVVEYVNAYRVHQAAVLLRQSQAKIVHVALDVGFENTSYFIKVFREHMLCTPSEYRKQLKSAASPQDRVIFDHNRISERDSVPPKIQV